MLYEAAQLLYPGPDAISLAQLGEHQAKVLPGFYQFMLSIPAKDFILKKFSIIWKSFYDTGQCRVEMTGDKSANFILSEYPDYPEYCQQFMVGWIKGFGHVLKMNVKSVACDCTNRHAITWVFNWE